MTPLIILEASFCGLFSDTRQLAEATLIAVGAIVIGLIVWPANMSPRGRAVVIVAGLANAGSCGGCIAAASNSEP